MDLPFKTWGPAAPPSWRKAMSSVTWLCEFHRPPLEPRGVGLGLWCRGRTRDLPLVRRAHLNCAHRELYRHGGWILFRSGATWRGSRARHGHGRRRGQRGRSGSSPTPAVLQGGSCWSWGGLGPVQQCQRPLKARPDGVPCQKCLRGPWPGMVRMGSSTGPGWSRGQRVVRE